MMECEMHFTRTSLTYSLSPHHIALLEVLEFALVGTEEIARTVIAIVAHHKDTVACGVLCRIDIGCRLCLGSGGKACAAIKREVVISRAPCLTALMAGGMRTDYLHAELVPVLEGQTIICGACHVLALERLKAEAEPHSLRSRHNRIVTLRTATQPKDISPKQKHIYVFPDLHIQIVNRLISHFNSPAQQDSNP